MTTPNDPYNQGGQPQQPGGYPPAAPPLNESELRRPERPKSVETAYKLWLVAAGIGILSNLISLITAADMARKVAEQTGVSVDAAQPSYAATIFSLALVVVWIVVVMQMRKGANWARIVLTVLGVLAVIGNLLSLLVIGILFSLGFLGVLQALFVLVSLVAIIGAIVFMFKSDSNHYFKHS